jgi:AcrR family transcriptional regulator
MDNQDAESNTRPLETPRQQARAQRILDAAAELVLRWGYDKTTIDDVAKQAGVSRGTVYLRWKTRDELFDALVKRETAALLEDYRKMISEDPAGATLRSIYKYSALALTKRPLLKAFLLRDMEVIGKLARSEHSTAAYAERLAGYQAYLEFLRERGLVRDDISLRAQVYIVSAVMTGFFLAAPLVPEEFRLSDEELAEMVGETIHCTLERTRTASPEDLQAMSETFMPYLDRVAANTEAQAKQKPGE